MIHKGKEIRILITLSSVLLLLGLIIGFTINNKKIDSNIIDTIRNNAVNRNFMVDVNLFHHILFQNLKLIILLTLGSVLFGGTTFINLIANGLNFSILIISSNSHGIGFEDFMILTFPHAIFEIPAIIIAGAAGFKIPCEIIRYLAGKKEEILTKEDIKEYLTLALISIILIVIAAWIEAYITPKIAEHFLSK